MPLDLQPTLTGALVLLRPLQPSDWNAVYAVASDPLIWQQHPASDRYQEPVFRAFFHEALESRGAFAVLDVSTGDVIGSTRYHGYDQTLGVVEIGWTFLARSHWGGRYNGEMKQLLLDHAFSDVESVVFHVGPDNRRSQIAVERIGGVRDGVRRDAAGRESVVFRITRSAWQARRQGSPQSSHSQGSA